MFFAWALPQKRRECLSLMAAISDQQERRE